MTRDARRDIEPLVASLRFTPYQQFGSNKVVLRAELDIDLWNALPYVVRAKAECLLAKDLKEIDLAPLRISTVIDLFEPSLLPKLALQIFDMCAVNTMKTVAEKLGVAESSVKRCLRYAEKMHIAGVKDPFIRLESEPESASRWRIKRSA